ncbi:phosphomannomutase/phosphoglucomutase [Thalassolituus sp. LLYu03]|uniref:phosphomannomutase/phosphoglucomutase n=1 Tax=Thalassolituus sp. LLYu03 TaxID=3421656 RepID=UPI003D2B8EF2
MSSNVRPPKRTIIFYSRITIWLALLFITGGMAVQSVQVNLITQSDVDKAFSEAMAEQMSHALSTRLQDTRRLQTAATNHPFTLQALDMDDVAWRSTLRQFLPGVSSLRLIRRDEAMGLQTTHGYAVQELVSRTLNGADMRMEAVMRDGALHFYWASPIRNELKQITGVLLAEYGSNWLAQFQAGTSQKLGQVVVNQYVDNDRAHGLEIFRIGDNPKRPGTIITRPINDFWYLTYIPSDERPQLSVMPLVTPWLITLVATLIGLFIMVGMQKRDILRNQLKLLTYVRALSRRGEDERPKFTLAIFHELADHMQHLINTMRPIAAAPAKNEGAREKVDISFEQPRKTNAPRTVSSSAPLPGLMVEEMEHENVPVISQDIFRAYDIRGIVGKDLTADTCYWIARAVGAEVRERGLKKISLGWDGRHSSPELAKEVQRGLVDSGCDVIRLGAVPTGLLYFATHETDASSGIMITGSHNPAEYNGLKVVIDQQTLMADELMMLYHRIARGDLPKGNGFSEDRRLHQEYVSRMEGDIQIGRDLKIVIDAGNGIAGPFAKALMDQLHIEAECLYCDVDGSFPNHHPDPSIPENLAALQAAVTNSGADLGIAFDGDGDRVALVDNTGKIIWPDRLLMLLVEDILPRNPGRDVLFDVKSSRHLSTLISRHGGRPTMWKTGHSLMKRKMKETNAVVGGEFSGHFYIQDRWYGFDDGLYTAARLLELLSQRGQSVSEVFAALPEDTSTPEITIATTDQRKFSLMEQLAKDTELTAGARVFSVDGVRIEFANGWGLIRPSNTTPKLTLRFAGNDSAAIAQIQARMKQALTRHAPELNVPF